MQSKNLPEIWSTETLTHFPSALGKCGFKRQSLYKMLVHQEIGKKNVIRNGLKTV